MTIVDPFWLMAASFAALLVPLALAAALVEWLARRRHDANRGGTRSATEGSHAD